MEDNVRREQELLGRVRDALDRSSEGLPTLMVGVFPLIPLEREPLVVQLRQELRQGEMSGLGQAPNANAARPRPGGVTAGDDSEFYVDTKGLAALAIRADEGRMYLHINWAFQPLSAMLKWLDGWWDRLAYRGDALITAQARGVRDCKMLVDRDDRGSLPSVDSFDLLIPKSRTDLKENPVRIAADICSDICGAFGEFVSPETIARR